ncbi:PREDICTED: endogenous retrovirus group K member 18 Pol protein-like [Pseudopodoces humilis]|uniref:endogenous retrovirus group K member 18 Pol protein-like n=1 Tax=Pseudopodoces humilis TaxID=181119 RepID=UPI0006B79CC2|nr:PREDICTED: endogenous retrovirus group K member 18 Pol protein-like [Pseudopodoces humilis]
MGGFSADSQQGFLVGVTEKRATPTIPQLTWKQHHPVWVDQWPLSETKLRALEALVEEQLAKGHITESNSPWNSPVFVLRKPGKDRWRLLHDLLKINDVIEDMGPLQPGMPSPSMLPRDWKLAVIDIKDCFFNIPLHPRDAPRFAFSVPSPNRQAPLKRYHWLVLPQGMKNSPTICQWYVAHILSPVRTLFPDAVILHYMDDILVCAADDDCLHRILQKTIQTIEDAGFEICEDKIHHTCPWTYLGLQIREQTIVPQQLTIKDDPKTLRDLHQLCGSINWIRPLLGVTTEVLVPLFNLLRGSEALDSPRSLTPEARESITKVQEALSSRQAHRYEPSLPFQLVILGKAPRLHALIFQWDTALKDPLLIIEWIFTHNQPTKTITTLQEIMAELIKRARVHLRTLAACEFTCIFLPLATGSLEPLLQTNESLQFALDSYSGQISIHPPGHRLFKTTFNLVPKSLQSKTLLQALTVFTGGSGKSHKSVMTWKDPRTQKWESDVQVVEGSPQIAELAAVVRAFEKFQEPFNLVTDSAYVAGIAMRAEHAFLKEVSNPNLYKLLSELVYLISHRKQPYYVMHVRAHTDLPGAIAEGNRRADALAMPAGAANVPDIFTQVKLSHQFFHQNVPALMRMFRLPRDQARAIVATCPNCQSFQIPVVNSWVYPRGLKSCQIWQTNVTHVPSFGRVKYVHVSVDTFSGAVFASAHAGENAKHTIRHFLLAFATLGVPEQIKIDNGPGYTSHKLRDFFNEWGVKHTTGIPHSPTGQSIVERTHQNLKRVLDHQWGGTEIIPPIERLCKALYVMNFLNCSPTEPDPPVIRHFSNSTHAKLTEKPPVLIKDPESQLTSGPFPLITWGRGSKKTAIHCSLETETLSESTEPTCHQTNNQTEAKPSCYQGRNETTANVTPDTMTVHESS